MRGGGVYINDNQIGTIQSGSFIHKTKESEIWVQVIGGLPSDKDTLISEDKTKITSEEELDLDASLSSDYISAQSIFVIYANFTGTMKAKTTTTYKTVQSWRKTTYSNKPKGTFKPGTIELNYQETVSNYTKNLGASNEVEYSPNNSINNINISYDTDDFDKHIFFTIHEGLNKNFGVSRLPLKISILELVLGANPASVDFPSPMSLTMYAYVTSGTGQSIGLHKNIKASGFIEYP